MSEGLSRERRVRGGHRGSAPRMLQEVYDTIESTVDRDSIVTIDWNNVKYHLKSPSLHLAGTRTTLTSVGLPDISSSPSHHSLTARINPSPKVKLPKLT